MKRLILAAVAIGVLACARPAVLPELVPEPAVVARVTAPVDTSAGPATFPPTAIELFMLPLPIPADVRGFHLEARFEVSPTGAATLITMTRSANARYNVQLQSALKTMRFRPGTAADGKPARGHASIIYDF